MSQARWEALQLEFSERMEDFAVELDFDKNYKNLSAEQNAKVIRAVDALHEAVRALRKGE